MTIEMAVAADVCDVSGGACRADKLDGYYTATLSLAIEPLAPRVRQDPPRPSAPGVSMMVDQGPFPSILIDSLLTA